MRYGIPSQRPERWRLNRAWPLWGNLVFAGLGASAGAETYIDSSAWANHGRLSGVSIPATVTSGWRWNDYLRRPALLLDGLGPDVVSLGSPPHLTNLGLAGYSWTFSRWTYLVTRVTWSGDVVFNRTGMGINGFGNWVALRNNRTARTICSARTGAWDHLGATEPGAALVTTEDLSVTGYCNGKPMVGDWWDSGPWGLTAGASIGLGYGATTNMNGYVADPLIWNRVLAAGEMQQIADPVLSRDLRVGGIPLLLPVRRWWPAASVDSGPSFKSAWASCVNTRIGMGV